MHDRRFLELDLTRAGVIGVQSSLSEAALKKVAESWDTEYEIDGVHYRVSGTARHGRPSGSDNDVMLALRTLFIMHGCPNSNQITFKASELIGLYSMLPAERYSNQYYSQQRDALLRLAGTSWTVVRSVWDEKTKRHVGDTITTHLFDIEVEDFGRSKAKPFGERQISGETWIQVMFSKRLAELSRLELARSENPTHKLH